jgi:hypothetical protein
MIDEKLYAMIYGNVRTVVAMMMNEKESFERAVRCEIFEKQPWRVAVAHETSFLD